MHLEYDGQKTTIQDGDILFWHKNAHFLLTRKDGGHLCFWFDRNRSDEQLYVGNMSQSHFQLIANLLAMSSGLHWKLLQGSELTAFAGSANLYYGARFTKE